MKMRNFVLAVAALAFAACATVPRGAAEKRPVALKFKAMVGSEEFACGKSYSGIGTTKSRITPSDFRFYVSKVELLGSKGEAAPLELDQDGVWQYQNVALLDFEDGSGPCRNGNQPMNTSIRGVVPGGDYNAVRFTIGIPFELNHADPLMASSPLNLTAMFWVWQAGYKFVKLDMATSGQPLAPAKAVDKAAVDKASQRAAGFPVHLGSTGCASGSKTTPPKSACVSPNLVTVTLNNFDIGKNEVVADIAALLRGANVDVNIPQTAPGCMSSPDDGDCAGVMPAFGLPFGGKPAGLQRFFSMR